MPSHNPNWSNQPPNRVFHIVGLEGAAQLGIRGSTSTGFIFESGRLLPVGVIDTVGAGGGGIGVSAGGFYSQVHTPSIDNLRGRSVEAGASAKIPLPKFKYAYGGVDWIVTEGIDHGFKASGGVGLGAPVSAHTQFSYSTVTTSTPGMIIRVIGGPKVGNAINRFFGFD